MTVQQIFKNLRDTIPGVFFIALSGTLDFLGMVCQIVSQGDFKLLVSEFI